MRKFCIYLFFLLFISVHSRAQYVQLFENKGELGVFAGQASYNGDIAPQLQFLAWNYGVFYKKQLNDYVGLRLNYETIPLGALDTITSKDINAYVKARGLYFKTSYQEYSLMSELYFLRFINGNKNFRFTPYLGIGLGYMTALKDASNAPNKMPSSIITAPINLGFKYNIAGSFNLFAEFTYRFTNTDSLDHFADNHSYINPIDNLVYQPSASGKDQFFSAKLGLTYNLLKIYGPDPRPKAKRNNISSKESNSSKKAGNKGLFGFFKRK